ncbi:uncharacterized protein IL334_005677 [Kwoniella shivajii]|uniref:Uncharacterized protein n=1 Tax=Kwoniella shivajii TaxID=564305 RepID=A0ABZ1D7S4_9TREE|nr:hypothetical protein IL334_005677 [Kwoniella shivajii]
MAPSGLVITKLGVQATSSDDQVKGLLCLKISLPKDAEGRPGARWALFNSNPPKLLSAPTILPLPLPLPASRTPSLRTAATLLSLSASTSYPPSSPSGLGGKPYIDVSSTTGKIFVVVDPVSGRKGSQNHRSVGSSSTQGARKDWLVCMEFTVPLEQDVEEGISKVLLPLPKCLDNIIRFQILSPSSASSSPSSMSSVQQEVNILTDPKMLPLPPTGTKSSPRRRSNFSDRRDKPKGKLKATLGEEEGWEDGEDLGPDDVHSESGEETEMSDEGSDQESGSWLEGRFPCTDILRLEWSFNSPSSFDIPTLQISPTWSKRQSSISIAYLARIPDTDMPVQLAIDVPDGWGWSDLSIQGEGLSNWRCVHGGWTSPKGEEMIDPDTTLEAGEYEDSFATVRAKRNRLLTPTSSSESDMNTFHPTVSSAHSSASLMRQTLPSLGDKMEDFSFELSSLEQKPLTPKSLRKSPLQMLVNSTSSSNGKWDEPREGNMFSLYFEDQGDRSITVQATLVPIDQLMLISPSLPVKIPFVRIGDERNTQCQVQCPSATYGSASTPSSEMELINTSLGGSFTWTDGIGHPLSIRGGRLKGNVFVKLRRSTWGIITASMTFPFPKNSEEVGFIIPLSGEMRISKTTLDGAEVPKAVYSHDGKSNIRIAKREEKAGGTVEFEWDVASFSKGDIGLPTFEDAEGELKVELIGDDWTSCLKSIVTNLTSISSTTFTYPLSSSQPTFTLLPISSTTKKKKTLLSLSTLINLFMIWLLLSMGQQIQRLRNDIEFVKDEYKDLRLYGIPQSIITATTTTTITEEVFIPSSTTTTMENPTGAPEPNLQQDLTKVENKENIGLVIDEKNYPLGRVVFGNMGQEWEKWLTHPTVRTITRGVSWIWNTVINLIIP